ncbi:hypothetical protein PR048_006360 [Dryococelus australis]|uniref:Uncharacterized protein n=1 Tax=Dryococelus australis TaxID=614101 RepID=A0ABQ9IAR7_9NEOP|nr:hypothetical protein PR048_006360 [Dryococelus australis]
MEGVPAFGPNTKRWVDHFVSSRLLKGAFYTSFSGLRNGQDTFFNYLRMNITYLDELAAKVSDKKRSENIIMRIVFPPLEMLAAGHAKSSRECANEPDQRTVESCSRIQAKWAVDGATTQCNGDGEGSTTRKPAGQRATSTTFQECGKCGWSGRDSNPIRFGGYHTTAVPVRIRAQPQMSYKGYVLTGVLSNMSPAKLVTMDGKIQQLEQTGHRKGIGIRYSGLVSATVPGIKSYAQIAKGVEIKPKQFKKIVLVYTEKESPTSTQVKEKVSREGDLEGLVETIYLLNFGNNFESLQEFNDKIKVSHRTGKRETDRGNVAMECDAKSIVFLTEMGRILAGYEICKNSVHRECSSSLPKFPPDPKIPCSDRDPCGKQVSDLAYNLHATENLKINTQDSRGRDLDTVAALYSEVSQHFVVFVKYLQKPHSDHPQYEDSEKRSSLIKYTGVVWALTRMKRRWTPGLRRRMLLPAE